MMSADYQATRRAVSYYLIPPGPKYLPHHPILENLQTITLINLPASFIILYYDKQLHNYLTNYHTSTCFDTIVLSSGSIKSAPCQVIQVFKMQLFVIKFIIKMFLTKSLHETS
jgi:hypothetical protein